MNRRRRWVFRIAASLMGLAGALLVTEVAFRVFDIRPPAAPPADQVDAFRVRNEVNRLRLREAEGFPPPRVAGEYRIACLGDSMTYGEGVEAEQAYPKVMQRLLNGRGGRTWTVVNMGWLGDDPAQERARYERLAPEIRPDVLVLMMYVNDFQSRNPAADEALHRIFGIRDNRFMLSEFSYLFHYAERKIRLRMAYEETIRLYHAEDARGVAAEYFDPVMAEVRGLRDFAEARGARFVLALMPWLIRFDDYPLRGMHAQIQSFAEKHRIPYCDLLPAFAGQNEEAMRVSLANHHPSAAGHEIAARALIEFLSRGGLLPQD